MYRAVVFVPSEDQAHKKWLRVCGERCTTRGYLIIAVAGEYADAVEMVLLREADVIVVARREHLPPGRLPLMEIVAEERLLSRPDPRTDPVALERPHRRWEAQKPPD